MALHGPVAALLLAASCWWMLALAAEEDPAKPASSSPPAAVSGPGKADVRPPGNSSSPAAGNSTAGGGRRAFGGFSVDSSMIQRALYVLIGITLTGLLYFLIRAVRLKKPAPKKKYGLLSDYDDSVEMEGVESEEDDTLYEARALRR